MPSSRRLISYWGGTVTHVDNPVIYLNGANGSSEAYAFEVQGYKIVYLSVNVKFTADMLNKNTDGGAIGKLPESLKPDDALGIPLTQNAMLMTDRPNDHTILTVWHNDLNDFNYYSNSVFYLVKS